MFRQDARILKSSLGLEVTNTHPHIIEVDTFESGLIGLV